MDIAPVELALATVGIRGIILGDIEKIRASHFHDMANLGREIEKQARSLIQGNGGKLKTTKLDYKPMLRALADGIDNQRIEDTLAAFPKTHRELATLFSIHATQIANQLVQFIPRSEYQTATGVIPLAPSDTRIWKFFSTVDILEDPMSVFALMGSAALLKSQAKAMRAVYPTLSACIDQSLQAAIIAEKTEKKSFEVNPRVDYGLRTWMLQPPVSPKMMGLAQENASDLTKQANLLERAQKKPPHATSEQVRFDATQEQAISVAPGFGRS